MAKKKEATKKQAKILVNADAPEEIRVCLLENGLLQAFQVENQAWIKTRGNIYKGRIVNVEPGLQAAFVDVGLRRNVYLPFNDIHPDYYGYAEDRARIPELLEKGQEILVQVVKEETQLKGAAVTTFLSIPGRYLVLMPGSDQMGISRKIESEEERKRIKDLLKELERPEGVGLIARTVTEDVTKQDIKKDLSYLLRLWQDIRKKAKAMPAPSVVYSERELVIRFLRDYLTSDVQEVLVDDEETFEAVKSFLRIIAPRHVSAVGRYEGMKPIFAHFDVERQIAGIFDRRVALPSGGSIIIEPTEALVSIDVNSGKLVHEKDFEETAYNTNLEAAEEIARQLRLRDLGGIIVVDFIDMRARSRRQDLERRMKEHLKRDRARTEALRIGDFGTMEMVRQKIGSPVQRGQYGPCPCCAGKGIVRTRESLALGHLRALRERLADGERPEKSLLLEVPPQIASYLLNAKRDEISGLERLFGARIRVEADPGLGPEDARIGPLALEG